MEEVAEQVKFDITRDFKKSVSLVTPSYSLRILKEKIRADTTFHVSSKKLLCHSFIILGQSEKLAEFFVHGTENLAFPENYSDITFGSLDACVKFLYYR